MRSRLPWLEGMSKRARQAVGIGAGTAAPRRPASHRGQSLVEFALILPVFALIFLGVIDLGRVFYTYEAVANAAREAARYCALSAHNSDGSNNGSAASLTTSRVKDSSYGELANTGINLASVTVQQWTPSNTSACDGSTLTEGNPVTVKVTAWFRPITPLIDRVFASSAGGNVTLSASGTMMVTR
jgi:Flp pilus assembly protein TadG